MIVAHIAGVPVEESLLALAGGTGTALLLARAWVVARLAAFMASDNGAG